MYYAFCLAIYLYMFLKLTLSSAAASSNGCLSICVNLLHSARIKDWYKARGTPQSSPIDNWDTSLAIVRACSSSVVFLLLSSKKRKKEPDGRFGFSRLLFKICGKYSVDAVPPGLILVVIESFAAAAIRGPKCKIEGRLRKGPDQVTAGYHLLLCSDNLDNYVERILAIYHLDLVSRWRAKMERLELLGLEAARARRDWKRSWAHESTPTTTCAPKIANHYVMCQKPVIVIGPSSHAI